MVTIPPLVRDPPSDDRQSSTARPVAARMARTQRRYASNYNISYRHEPPKPITRAGFPTPESTFDKWRAAAELDPPASGAGSPPYPAARGGALASGVAARPRRMLHDALLGTTAVVLLGVLGGIGALAWSGAVPGAAAPGGTASKGSGIAALVRPLADFAAKTVTRAEPDPAPPSPPGKDAAADVPAPLPAVPDRLALAAPSADQPALAGSPPSAPDPLAVAGEAVPPPERTAGSAASAKPSEPDAVAPAPGPPAVVAAVPPAAAVADRVAATVEQATAEVVPPAKPSAPDAAPPVPSIAAATVRLAAAPEWTAATAPELASLPEAATLLTATAAVPAEVGKAVLPGVDVQQVVSTMELVQQMSLLVHDMHGESLRYRTEVTALTGAVQAKASSLEERLKLAEARSAAGAGADAGDGGGLRAAAMPQVLRGYRVQAGSPGAAVLSDVGAGPERAARLLVMVGDQLPGAGRVTAIVQRGRAWIVRTERGVIQ